MTRKDKCAECRYCEMRVDARKGIRHFCAPKKRLLPVDLSSKPACDKFRLPYLSGQWGP